MITIVNMIIIALLLLLLLLILSLPSLLYYVHIYIYIYIMFSFCHNIYIYIYINYIYIYIYPELSPLDALTNLRRGKARRPPGKGASGRDTKRPSARGQTANKQVINRSSTARCFSASIYIGFRLFELQKRHSGQFVLMP